MRDLSREAETIRDRLQQLPAVQKAMILGDRPERVFIDFDMDRLNNLGVTPEQIFAAIDASNTLIPEGSLDLNGPRAYLRTHSDLSDPDKLADLPLRVGNALIRLSDIAEVSRGYEDPPTYLVRANSEDAILLGVVMNKGENGLAFGESLANFLDKERSNLPLGVSLQVLTNQTDAISQAVDLFQVKFLVAVLVVMAVTVIAIGFRAGLVVGIAIPITIGLTFLIMKMVDINLDRVTLGALIIALGLLVDDAIISIEKRAGIEFVLQAMHGMLPQPLCSLGP